MAKTDPLILKTMSMSEKVRSYAADMGRTLDDPVAMLAFSREDLITIIKEDLRIFIAFSEAMRGLVLRNDELQEEKDI